VQLQYQDIVYVAGQKSREAQHQVTCICEGNIPLSIVLGGTLFPLPQHPRKLTRLQYLPNATWKKDRRERASGGGGLKSPSFAVLHGHIEGPYAGAGLF
jgi:hypothetical protein